MPQVTKTILGLLVFALLLIARVSFLFSTEAAQTLPHFVGTTATTTGIVAADPDVRATEVRINVQVATINGAPGSGIVQAVLPPGTKISYNDILTIRGAVVAPAAFTTDSGRVFDYPGYLRVQGVSALMQKTKLIESAPGGFSLRGILFTVKHAFEQSIEKVFPAQDASLMEGVLLGERHGLPLTIENALVAAGLIHIVILAGYALSLVSQGVLDALSFLRPRTRYVVAAAALILFVLMTGAAATTVRACMMAVIAMFARYLHRPSVALRSLAAVAAGMILWNPLYIFDESFVISVLATFGLITLSPLCEWWLRWLPERFDLRAIASSTLAVQLFALPALLYFTGTLSLYALPANLIALPALPWAMFFGFLAGVLGLIHPLLAIIPALLADALLRFMLFVAHIAASLPFGGASIPPFPTWVAVLIYLPLTALAIVAYRRNAARSHSSSSS
jgi:competence protein ComEC